MIRLFQVEHTNSRKTLKFSYFKEKIINFESNDFKETKFEFDLKKPRKTLLHKSKNN